MTNGQIQRLQELRKCYMPWHDARWVIGWLFGVNDDRMTKEHKATLRRLTHLYRNQIAAIRKNQR